MLNVLVMWVIGEPGVTSPVLELVLLALYRVSVIVVG